MSRKKLIIIIVSVLISLIVLVAIAGVLVYNKMKSSAFAGSQESVVLYIDNNQIYEDVLEQLRMNGIKDIALFDKLSNYMKYPDHIKSGKYEAPNNITYIELVRQLRSGRQTPVKFTFNNVRTKTDFAERVEKQLMVSSEVLLRKMNDPSIAGSYGFDTLTIASMFIPNTYEIYWNTDEDAFLDRMKKEYDRFWTDDRKDKAQVIGLSPVEVSVLASIVEEETAQSSEYPVVAGLYLNRLKKGMLLQADPTVKYAVGDFMLKRILNKHLQVDSPYNTYKHTGLPPGPIRIPSIRGIDAVLNYTKHPYIYMCAKEDFSGTHNFAVTLSEHNKNARKYQAALNRLNIR